MIEKWIWIFSINYSWNNKVDIFIFCLQIEKAIVPYKEIETSGNDRSAEVQFEAMMVDIGDISGSQDRHITAGLEYGDSGYIWVGQAKVTTKATLKTMDVSIF